MIKKRTVLIGMGALTTGYLLARVALAQAVSEQQFGDPGTKPETFDLSQSDLSAFDFVMQQAKPLNIAKPAKTFAQESLLAAASSQLENSRATTPEEIKSYLELFGINPLDSNGRILAFCAAGISWAACKAYCDMQPQPRPYDSHNQESVFKDTLADIRHYFFSPHCSCETMVSQNKAAGRWVDPKDKPQRGWLVLYTWDRDGHANHVGVIESVKEPDIHTIEFNTSETVDNQTNGGVVARKRRPMNDQVLGYVRTF